MAGPALKWWMRGTRMFFAGEEAGGGSEAPSAPVPADGGGSGDGGGSPAPSSTPPSEPAAVPDVPDWANLGSAEDLDFHVEVPAETTPPPKPEEPPTPQPAPPAQPVPPAAQPEAQPATTPQPSATGTGEARPLSAAEPWRIAEGLEANRDAIIAHLASAKFALSEEDIKDLDTDVTVAVPKLLARVFLESQVSMQKFLAQAVPGMVKQFNTVTSANTRAEDAFFAMHKALDVNNPLHRSTAVRIATVYRQANPDIPLNQLIAEVGPMVMAALRVNAPAQGSAVQPAAGRLARSAGFVPAVNGGGGVSPSPEPGSPWAGLGQSFDE